MRKDIVRIAVLATAAAAIGWTDAALRPLTLALPGASGAGPPEAGMTPGGPWVTLDQARTLHLDPTVAFVDASRAEDWRRERIPGSWGLPPEEFAGGGFPALLDQLSRSSPVVVYCQSDQCEAAELVALRMVEFGFSDVRVFRGGLAAWKAAGFPTQTAG